MATLLLILSIFTLATLSVASDPTPIYINDVPEYSSLSSCAISKVSAVVRDMDSGCGDNTAYTSFACFCIQSSITFNSIISQAVLANCDNQTAQASSALNVFASYCSLGSVTAITTSSSSQLSSSSAVTAAAATTIIPTTTSRLSDLSSTPASSNPTSFTTIISTATSNSHGHTTLSPSDTVGVAVAVSLGVVALVTAAAFAVWRRRRSQSTSASTQLRAAELPNASMLPPTELPETSVRTELSSTNEPKLNELPATEYSSPTVNELPPDNHPRFFKAPQA